MPPRSAALIGALLLPAASPAEPAGPPRPAVPKRTAVEQTHELYEERYGLAMRRTSCAPARAGEVVVCGGTRSLYRVPLPDERPPPDHPRRPTGEIPRAGGGAEPVRATRGSGLALTFGGSKRPRVEGIGQADAAAASGP